MNRYYSFPSRSTISLSSKSATKIPHPEIQSAVTPENSFQKTHVHTEGSLSCQESINNVTTTYITFTLY